MSYIEAFNETTLKWEAHHISQLENLKIEKMQTGKYSVILILEEVI